MIAGGEGLGRWPVCCELPVQWGEMDALGHVNHTVYLKWMETARMRYFEACGLTSMFVDEGIGPILASVKVDYHAPTRFPDTVSVHTTISRIGRSSFDMSYRITSKAAQGKEVATGSVAGVVYDYGADKTIAMPDALRQGILEFEATGN